MPLTHSIDLDIDLKPSRKKFIVGFAYFLLLYICAWVSLTGLGLVLLLVAVSLSNWLIYTRHIKGSHPKAIRLLQFCHGQIFLLDNTGARYVAKVNLGSFIDGEMVFLECSVLGARLPRYLLCLPDQVDEQQWHTLLWNLRMQTHRSSKIFA